MIIFSIIFISTLIGGYFSIPFFTLSFASFSVYINIKREKIHLKKENIIPIKNNVNNPDNNYDNHEQYYPNPVYKRGHNLVKKKVKY